MNKKIKNFLLLPIASMMFASCYVPDVDEFPKPQSQEKEEEKPAEVEPENQSSSDDEDIHIPVGDIRDQVGSVIYIDPESSETEFVTFRKLEESEDITIDSNGEVGFSSDFKSKVKELNLPYLADNTIKNFNSLALKNCPKLEKVVLSYGFETLTDGCFTGCSELKSINISSTVSLITPDSFEYLENLEEIIVSEDNKVYDSRENCNAIIETATNKVIVFTKHSPLVEGVTSLGDGSLINRSIDVLNIPASLTDATIDSFSNCKDGIGKVEVNPENNSFNRFNNADSLVLSNGELIVASNSLPEELPGSISKIGKRAFSITNRSGKVIFPTSVFSFDTDAFDNSSPSIESFVFKCATNGMYASGIKKIRTKVIIDNSDASLISSTFRASQITSIEILGTVKTINDYCFQNCTELSSVTFGNTSAITRFGDDAFQGCKLTSFSCPSQLESIGSYCFDSNVGLASVEIPTSVTSIGANAFSGCSENLVVTYKGTKDQWEAIAGYNNAGIKKVKIGSTTYTYS